MFYEWWMLTEAELKLAQASLDRPTQNAWIESGAIHARNLKVFFYRGRFDADPQNDNVFAEDLLPQLDWHELRPPAPSALNRREFGDAANKQVAHFTKTGDPKKDWDFSVVADAIQPALEQFLTLLPMSDLGDRWRAELLGKSGPRWSKLREILRERGDG